MKSIFRFLEFSEKNGCKQVLDSEKQARRAFTKYTHYLNTNIRSGSFSQWHAGSEQRQAAIFIEQCFNLPNTAVLNSLPVIKKTKGLPRETTVIRQENMSFNMGMLISIFDSIYDFCLEKKKYPCQLDIGGKKRWIFPQDPWIKNASGHLPGNYSRVLDYENGKVREYKDAKSFYVQSRAAEQAIAIAKAQIKESNEDERHRVRIRLAMQAHDSFVLMFIAVTGMNLNGVRNLKWGKDIIFSKTSLTVRTVKFRARNKECSFNVQARFLPYVRKYLKLREFIVGNNHVEWLFIQCQNHARGPFDQVSVSFSKTASARFNREIDSQWVVIKAKEWRANKAEYFLNNTDVMTTARELQNTEQTVRKYYSDGSVNVAKDEFTEFFNNGLPLRKRKTSNGKETPVGICRNYGNPKTTSAQMKAADCETWEGCLGCKNYACHADTIDVRKLLSARDIVLATKHLAISESYFNQCFGLFLTRISEIVEMISSFSHKHKTMVDKVTAEVSNGHYDEYWSAKLEMLISIGVINE